MERGISNCRSLVTFNLLEHIRRKNDCNIDCHSGSFVYLHFCGRVNFEYGFSFKEELWGGRRCYGTGYCFFFARLVLFFPSQISNPLLGGGEKKFVVIQLILFVVILMLLSGTVIYNLILGTDYTVLAPIAFFLAMALSKVPLFSCTIGSLVSEVRISLLKKSGSEYSTLHHNLDELPPPPSTTASELPVPPGTDSSVNK